MGGWSVSGYTPTFGYGGGIYNAAGASALQMHDTIVAGDTAENAVRNQRKTPGAEVAPGPGASPAFFTTRFGDG
jgi:hypothetical protein